MRYRRNAFMLLVLVSGLAWGCSVVGRQLSEWEEEDE